VGAILNFCAYYIVGIPIGAYIAFRCKMGVIGLWFGMTLGLLSIAICGIFIISKSDWVMLANQARNRVTIRDSLVIGSPRMGEIL